MTSTQEPPPQTPVPEPTIRATATGVWPGADPREGAHAAFSELAEGLPPFTFGAQATSGGTAWAYDAIGFAASLLDGLPVDAGSYGWRLARGEARDTHRQYSRFARALDAHEEYGHGYAGQTSAHIPGPWTLIRRLSLPNGNPVLSDPGAVRDVLHAYAAGVKTLVTRLSKVGQVRVFVVEDALDEILTGQVPTVSGYRTLPALPDQMVTAGLRSFLARCAAAPVLALPRLGHVRIQGKEVAHRDLVEATTAAEVCLPFPTGAGLRAFEELAQWVESGRGVWLRLPDVAGERPNQVNLWIKAVSVPWTTIGMNATRLDSMGVVAGPGLPTGDSPVLGATSASVVRAGYRLACGIAKAFEEIQ